VLEEFELGLLRGKNFAHVETLAPDGSPRASIVWADTDGVHVIFNTAVGRIKDRDLRHDPRVSVTVHDQQDGYRWAGFRGRVAERITGPEAEEHIDRLNRKYQDGEPWEYIEGQVRVMYKVAPERVTRFGDD
jgi:PPOX class probable F420-dependent enzyme